MSDKAPTWMYVVSMLRAGRCTFRGHRLQRDEDATWCRHCGQVFWPRRKP